MSQPLTKRTYNILPSRMDYFDKRMKSIKSAADAKIPPIEFKIKKGNATTIPLDKILINRAKQNLIPDVRQLPNGDWVRDVIPVTIEYGELGDPDMEYIGRIEYAELFDTSTGQKKQGFFPDVKKEIGMTDAEYEKRVIEVTPQLEGMAQQFNSYKDLNCDHCSQTGDLKERHFVEIVRATKDHKRWGKGQKFKLDLKKGEIIQIGSKCMQKYSGIDVDKLAAFYELDRAIGAYGPNGSPQNPAGWGYKEMGVWDFAERMIQYYNQREKEWLAARRISLWEVETPDIIYSKGTLAPLIDRKIDYKKGEDGRQIKPKVETGCFVERAGNRLMRGRQFDMNENDPDKNAQWFFQPFTGDGLAEDVAMVAHQYARTMGKASHALEKGDIFFHDVLANPEDVHDMSHMAGKNPDSVMTHKADVQARYQGALKTMAQDPLFVDGYVPHIVTTPDMHAQMGSGCYRKMDGSFDAGFLRATLVSAIKYTPDVSYESEGIASSSPYECGLHGEYADADLGWIEEHMTG